MANTIEYEYSDGNQIDFNTEDLKITYHRDSMSIDARADGTRVVTDPSYEWREFHFTSVLTGANMNTLDGVQMAAITYSGAYPRIKTLTWASGETETNIEVVIPDGGLVVSDAGNGQWNVDVTMLEKAQ